MKRDDDLVLQPDSLTVGQARRLDLICDRFEAAWQTGKRPEIQAALADVPPGDRPALLRELVILDATYRRRLGELATAADYAARYPELDANWLASALATSTPTQVLPTPQGSSASRDDPTIDSQPDSSSGSFPHLVRYFGDYELLAEIARGGMGVVYKARQVSLNRTVAVKTILAGKIASPAEVERFRNEAEAAARLDHPHIVPVYEVGLHENQHYFSMGFVDGRGLDAVASENLLEPREAARIMAMVAEAVQYAHDRGVIHRDLKPSNILLDGEGNPRVTDFGLAKRVEDQSGITMTGQILGTPSYMPPEQAAGQLDLIGPHSDVYSLGAVLYALLTGRPPFKSASTVQTLRQVLEQEPLPPRELNPAIPLDLATIALKCLEKSASRRYPTARAVADELRRYLEGRPIEARPVTRFERGWRWCKRNPVVASLSALAIGLLLAISIGAGIAYQRESRLLSRETVLKNAAIAGEKREAGLRRDAEAEKRNALAAEQKATAAKDAAQAAERSEREQRLNAERQTRQAQMHRLAIQSQSLIKEYPDRGLLLASEAVTLAKAHGDPVPRQVEQILRTALASASDNRVGGAAGAVPGTLSHADISPDNRWLAFTTRKRLASATPTKEAKPSERFLEIYLFDLQNWGEELEPLVLKRPTMVGHFNHSALLRFSLDGRWLISTDLAGQSYLWDMRANVITDSLQEISGQGFASRNGTEWLSRSGRWGVTLMPTQNGKYQLALLDFATDSPGTPVEALSTEAPYLNWNTLETAPAVFSSRERFCAFPRRDVGHESDLLLCQLDAAPNVQRKQYLSGGERTNHKILGFSPDERWLLVLAETMSTAHWNAFTGKSKDRLVAERPSLKLVLWPTTTQAAANSGVVLSEQDAQPFAPTHWNFSSDGRWLFVVNMLPPKGARPVEPSGERLFPWVRADGQPVTDADLVRELLRFDLAEPSLAASKSVVAQLPAIPRCVLSAADGSWVAVGGNDQQVHVWKRDQPPADKPWKSLKGNDAVVTHLYRSFSPMHLISRSFVPRDKDEKLSREEEDAKGQCLLWDLGSGSDEPVHEFKSVNQHFTNEPAASSDFSWWVSPNYEVLDLSSCNAQGAGRYRFGATDISQPEFSDLTQGVFGAHVSGILRDRWLLFHFFSWSDEPSPLYLYPLGASPRPLEPRLLTTDSPVIPDRLQYGMKVSPDGRWIVQIESKIGGASEILLSLNRYDSESSAKHVIKLADAGRLSRQPHLILSPKGNYLACVFSDSPDSNLRVWRLADQAPPQLIIEQDRIPFDYGGPWSRFFGFAFSADERWLAQGADDRSVRLFDLAADDIAGSAQRLVPVETKEFPGRVRGGLAASCLEFSPDGRWLVGCFPELRQTVFWDMRAANTQDSQRSFDDDRVNTHALFLDGGQRLITVDAFGWLAEWNATELPEKLTSMRPTRSKGGDSPDSEIWLSPNRRYLAYMAGAQLAVWDLEKDRVNPSFHLIEQEGRINKVTFSHDSRLLVTSCPGREGAFIRLWDLTSGDVSKSGILLPTPSRFHISDAGRLTVTPDNRFLIAAGPTALAVWTLPIDELYALARSVAGRELTADERKLYEVPPREFPAPEVKRPTRPALFGGGR